MDFYQDQANKDTSGWFGPAIVVDLSRQSHNSVTVRYNNKLREVMGQNIRRHLFFLVGLAATQVRHFQGVWRFIRHAIERADHNRPELLGYVKQIRGYAFSRNNSKFPGLFDAVKFFSENHLHFPSPTTARIGYGLSRLKPLQGYVGSVVLMWLPQWSNFQTLDQGRSGKIGFSVSLRKLFPAD